MEKVNTVALKSAGSEPALNARALVVACAAMVSGCGDRGSVPELSFPEESALALTLVAAVDGYQVPFGEIGAVIADAAGNLYVADVMAREVVVLDGSGRRIRTIGGPGSGPAEFGSLAPTLAWMGETLVTLDQRRQRFIYFSQQGESRGSASVPDVFIRTGTTLFSGAGDLAFARLLTSDPTPVVLPPPSAAAFGALVSVPTPPPIVRYATLRSDGSVSTLLAPFDEALWPPSVNCARTDGSGIIEIFPIPYADWRPLQAVTPGGTIAIASRNTYRINLLDAGTGQPVGAVTREVPFVAVEDDDWESHPSIEWLRTVERESGSRLVRNQDRSQPCPVDDERPAQFPPIRAAIPDDQSRLWVEGPTAGGFELSVIDTDGAVVGVTAMPPRDESVIPYVRANRLYIVTKDSLDVQSIEIHELVPR